MLLILKLFRVLKIVILEKRATVRSTQTSAIFVFIITIKERDVHVSVILVFQMFRDIAFILQVRSKN